MTPGGLKPAATVPGPKGAPGDPGPKGDPGTGGNLSNLDDVTLTSPVDEEVLQFDGTQWTNQTISIPTKTDLGLDQVDNTSDLNKPISTATQNALDTKANVGEGGTVSSVAGRTGDVTLTADDVFVANIPNIGDAYMGGYFAGIVDTTQSNIIASDANQVGQKYMVIVSPLSLEMAGLSYKDTLDASPVATRTLWDGLTATQAMVADAAPYPAAEYCDGLAFPSDGGSKWYLPAIDELELVYRNLKSTTEPNSVGPRDATAGSFPGSAYGYGENPSSSPAGSAYTAGSPAQTLASLFVDGGGQDLGDNGVTISYRASTEHSDANCYTQRFSGTFAGSQPISTKSLHTPKTRPIRRVSLPPDVSLSIALTDKATPADITAASTADRNRANHTGTQSADTVIDGTTNKVYTATEQTKLSGIATGATANSPDATLLSRANHVGTQPISTVTGLQTALDSAGAVKTVAGKIGDVELLASDIAKTVTVLPNVGDAVYGGYFAGIIDTTRGNILASDASQSGERYMLIISPRSLENSALAFETGSSAINNAAKTRWDGLSATIAMANDATEEYPAAEYCNGLTYPSDGGSQWYLPAMDESEVFFRNFKPGTANNGVDTFPNGGTDFPYGGVGTFGHGYNASSDPVRAAYTTTDPAQTSVTIFRTGGGQDVQPSTDWGDYFILTATKYQDTGVWIQSIGGDSPGRFASGYPGDTAVVRPVRRVPVPPDVMLDDALATKADVIGNDVTLVSATDQVASYTTEDDNSSTATWPNRFQWMFKPFGGVAKLVQWFNEYGEWRGIPAKSNTVGWRLFIKDAPGDPARSANAWEICDNRTDRNVIAAVDENGLTAKNINRRVETNPTGTAVPAGLPDGTVWIEYDPS